MVAVKRPETEPPPPQRIILEEISGLSRDPESTIAVRSVLISVRRRAMAVSLHSRCSGQPIVSLKVLHSGVAICEPLCVQPSLLTLPLCQVSLSAPWVFRGTGV
ncbi:unnamed protein product [Gadus morhua 'NCC']